MENPPPITGAKRKLTKVSTLVKLLLPRKIEIKVKREMRRPQIIESPPANVTIQEMTSAYVSPGALRGGTTMTG
jgi:hypothetical protein